MTTVLHVVATLDRGGTEVSALTLACEFARRGIANRVAALEPGGGAIASEFKAVAGVPTVLPGGRFTRARAMRKLVVTHRPDAILFHIFNAEHVVLGAAARLAGATRLVAVLGNPVAHGPAMAQKVRTLVRLTDFLGIRVVVASRWIERSLVQAGCAPRNRRVIHNGCDVETIGTRADAARIDCTAEVVIGMISRLDPIKDHATLLEAFALMPAAISGRRTRLILVGDGVLRAPLEAQAVRLGIADRTTFAGARRDVPEAAAQFDVFAFSTTRDEGFGVVLIEALAVGAPVVASDVPACREVLEDGALGRLVPPETSVALAEALYEVIVSPPSVPTRSEVARRYDAAAMADAYLAFLFPEVATLGRVEQRVAGVSASARP